MPHHTLAAIVSCYALAAQDPSSTPSTPTAAQFVHELCSPCRLDQDVALAELRKLGATAVPALLKTVALGNFATGPTDRWTCQFEGDQVQLNYIPGPFAQPHYEHATIPQRWRSREGIAAIRALGELGPLAAKAASAPLSKLALALDPEVRRAAEASLLRIGKPAIKHLLASLDGANASRYTRLLARSGPGRQALSAFVESGVRYSMSGALALGLHADHPSAGSQEELDALRTLSESTSNQKLALGRWALTRIREAKQPPTPAKPEPLRLIHFEKDDLEAARAAVANPREEAWSALPARALLLDQNAWNSQTPGQPTIQAAPTWDHRVYPCLETILTRQEGAIVQAALEVIPWIAHRFPVPEGIRDALRNRASAGDQSVLAAYLSVLHADHTLGEDDTLALLSYTSKGSDGSAAALEIVSSRGPARPSVRNALLSDWSLGSMRHRTRLAPVLANVFYDDPAVHRALATQHELGDLTGTFSDALARTTRGRPTALRLARQAIDSPSQADIARGLTILALCGREGQPYLAQALDGVRRWSRIVSPAAARLLGEIRPGLRSAAASLADVCTRRRAQPPALLPGLRFPANFEFEEDDGDPQALTKDLKHPDPGRRSIAVSRLATFGDSHRQQILAMITDPSPTVRIATLSSCAEFSWNDAVLATLQQGLKDGDKEVRQTAAHGLGFPRDEGRPDSVMSLRGAILDPEKWVRVAVIQCLVRRGADDAATAKDIAAMLKDPTREVQRAAAQVSNKISYRDPQFVAAVAAGARAEDSKVVAACLLTLTKWRDLDEEHRPQIRTLMDSRNPTVRLAAIQCMFALEPDRQETFLRIIQALEDEHSKVRRHVEHMILTAML